MTSVDPSRPNPGSSLAARALRASTAAWCAVAAVGIWIFAYYIIALYGGGLVSGDLERWNTVLPDGHGYVRGDHSGNLALGAHLVAAAVIALAGVLQLSPRIRRKAPAFHRWNGRVFIALAWAASLTGLIIAFIRGPVSGDYMTAGNLINTVLVLVFGGLAWSRARSGRMAAHQRWALRLFIVVYAVWFYRLGMMLWMVANGGPVGHTDAFDGPFDIFLAFAHVLAPLALLEIYFLARDRTGPAAKYSMAAAMAVLTLATLAASAAATAFMWLPPL